MDVTVQEVQINEILPTVRKTLGIAAAGNGVDDVLIAAMLRRSAGFLCPCSRASLTKSVIDSLEYLNADEELRDRIDTIIDGLVSIGDLLEMADVTTGDPDAKSTWVFLAPPGFMLRNNTAFLCGLTPDEALPIPPDYQNRVAYSGYSRSIKQLADEDLASVLSGFGLLAHSERAWLRLPKLHSAQEVLTEYRQRLAAMPASGSVEDLEIIDTAKPNNYYRGRWIKARNQTGTFIARREREYGAAIWGLAALNNGQLEKYLDLPVKGYKWRGRDAAWHLLLALDCEAGTPQKYRRKTAADGAVIIDFFSPIPVWAQRRLAIYGEPVPREKCLFSFKIPVDEIAAEEKFLSDYLWLVPGEK